jgi:2-dehydropantoate 2-reductase
MISIAMIGPGAIGGTVAAWLAQDPQHMVTIAARTAFEKLEVETPYGVIHARPNVLTEVSQAAPVDWILIATKAYDVVGAAIWLHGLRGPQTRVAVLQNGVEHVERFAPYLPVDDILPVMVDCPAERFAPGQIRQRGPGRMIVPQGNAGAAFVKLFAQTKFAVTESTDFKTEVWKKLCVNSAGALSALLLKAAAARQAGVANIMRDIVRECIAVGRAEGARLDDVIIDKVIDGSRHEPLDSMNSLLADRVAGRAMEIDARNGVIVRLGRKHGIATPINAMMVSLLEAVQPSTA